ncbi:MAG: tRNA (adenosine(37)-N6)-dimethylallyltransferase MiaA [Lachnospiraceae bacterium]|nr:tRNA (adenosine(37)-N6)-dimethylallyltransferase MiaA [Lachnospiraceae bacterium]
MEPLVVITGPTGVGKTRCSIGYARELGGEIISADSMQVYKGMDIGSAKIKKNYMQGIPHHLIDIIEPTEPFDVYSFKEYAVRAIKEIRGKDRLPVMVGGTGFYIQSVLYDIDFSEDRQGNQYRDQLLKLYEENGAMYLHGLLREVDPASADAIHPNNIKRTIRALEYAHETGGRISEHNMAERQKDSVFDSLYFVLTDERSILYENIEKRVDEMISEGLVEEVKKLMESGVKRDMTSMHGLGYREIYDHLSGEYDLERAIYLIKLNTRHFAKRQLTWFRREKNVIWVNKSDFSHDEDRILSFLIQKTKEHYDGKQYI